MIYSKSGIAYKNPWGASSFKPRDRMAGRTLHILFHFFAGLAVAAYLLPEGIAIVLGSLALIVVMKALYDYVDAGTVKFGCAVAMVVGGLLSLGISRFL